jgi:hypothetical protein
MKYVSRSAAIISSRRSKSTRTTSVQILMQPQEQDVLHPKPRRPIRATLFDPFRGQCYPPHHLKLHRHIYRPAKSHIYASS